MSDLSLSDLLKECSKCDGTGWQDGCAHGPRSMVSHMTDCGSRKVWPCELTEPATWADLRAVLEAEGATMTRIWHPPQWEGASVLHEVVEDGTYLVWRIEEVDSE